MFDNSKQMPEHERLTTNRVTTWGLRLVSSFRDHYSALSRLLLEYGNGEKKEEDQAETRASQAADAGATEFWTRGNAF